DTELLPIYIYYSIFGFQRVGDLIWAAADQRARGFLFGATAGRTTLSGEGLQHQDGSSHLMAGAVPNCRAFDPCFAYELAVILDYGMLRMLDQERDEFFYITVMNENYAQPSEPQGKREDMVRGMYLFTTNGEASSPRVRLLGAGTILREVIAAGEILFNDFGIASDVYSVTSFTELAREAMDVERQRRFERTSTPRRSFVEATLEGTTPIVAATDYIRAVPGQIAPYLEARMTLLGTDGFGRSASRHALRRFFEVDKEHIVLSAIESLVDNGMLPRSTLIEALDKFDIDDAAPAPWRV
ncbi:MAG: transketolase-like TK C-terminal-containing protein, partial [Gammaproteobacteria bacterium]